MSAHDPEHTDALVDALRADLPDEHDRVRSRARLLAAGVAVSSAVAASGAAPAGASALGSSAASAGAQVGLWPKLASLSLAQKLGVAVVLATAGGALPAAPQLMKAVQEMRASAPMPRARTAARVRPVRALASTATPAPAVTALAIPAAGEAVPQPVVAAAAPARAVHTVPNAALVPRATTVAVPGAAAVVSTTPPSPAPSKPVLAVDAREATPVAASAISPASETRAPTQAPSNDASLASAARTPSTLRAETELLERALSAISAGDLARARQWLAQHADRFPHGILERERERALRRVAQASMTPRLNLETGASAP